MFDLKTRILVVDDFESMRIMMTKTIREIGFKDIVKANNGITAWEALESSTPAVGIVISDWNMPKRTGIELLKMVRADARFKDLPFVLATTESESENVLEAVSAGASNFVVKPFTTEVLRKKLESVYAKHAKPAT